MEYRIIKEKEIESAVYNMCLECNYNIGDDITEALEKACKTEASDISRQVIGSIIENNEIAKKERLPICQDTGMVVVFAEYGDKVAVEGDFQSAVHNGIKRAYEDGYLRKSVVSDPVFDRKNTNDNTPAVIHTKIVKGDKIKIILGGKGFGSENMSVIKMLTPSDGIEGVKKTVIDAVLYAGSKPCPPIVIGVGIGGTFEKCAQLAKLAAMRPVNVKNVDERYALLEYELLCEINKTGIGAAGFGGNTTALGVNIEVFPTHIAGLPVAVNICCHAARHSSKEI